jgi:hypothetical protein
MVWALQGKMLTFGIPASVGLPQRQAVVVCHAAGPDLYHVVTAWDEIPVRLGAFSVVTCPVREIRIILLLSHLLPITIRGRETPAQGPCSKKSVGPVERFVR